MSNQKPDMKSLTQLALTFSFSTLCGCSLFFGPPREITMFKLVPPPCAEHAPSINVPGTLLVRQFRGEGLSESKSLVYNKSEITRGTYRLAVWTESPTRQLSRIVFDSLACGDHADKIVSGVEPVQYNYVLSGVVTDIRHNITDGSPGISTLSLELDLYQFFPKKLIARKRFSYAVPAPSFDAEGAVDGYNKEVITLGSDVREWVESALR